MEYKKPSLPMDLGEPTPKSNVTTKKGDSKKKNPHEPPNLGKAVHLTTPDFNDPNRPKTCLEVDFPIAPINALSNLEGNAGKPIYQMSKWWARRRSSVFRSLLIAAATQAPKDESQAAKVVWDAYYANHQKAGNFTDLQVLDPFMGGGTTIVEGARLGFQMTGVDLNPVAWFVVKNEVAGTDPAEVQAFFDHIEAEVKPQIQPFYTTSCPRGHEGRWLDVGTDEPVDVDPITLSPDERKKYRWDGPEIIYTFWAKHGHCPTPGCGHRTPIFSNLEIAQKNLSANVIPITCPHCQHKFQAELGETRMAPGAERVVLDSEPSFTEISQPFAQLMNDYNKGRADDKQERIEQLLILVDDETGLHCPYCDQFAGQKVREALTKQSETRRATDINKKVFGIKRYRVNMRLLLHPDWLAGASGNDENGQELGGYAGASPEATEKWYQLRQKGLKLVEIRGENLPSSVRLHDNTEIIPEDGTMSNNGYFTCASCGRESANVDASEQANHTAPVATYTLQCYCPQCDNEGYQYNGRYFKSSTNKDIFALSKCEHEWAYRCNDDLDGYWPLNEIMFSRRTHQKEPLPKHGYTHWWKMFNSRQLLIHSLFLYTITNSKEEVYVKEQALGAFQQYLRNQSMFVFWNIQRDTPEPMFSNANYNPKKQAIENNVFTQLGRGNWQSSSSKIINGLSWTNAPFELFIDHHNPSSKSSKLSINDTVGHNINLFCASSTEVSSLISQPLDLVITDPPFGGLLYYADLADFFYVWLRIPFTKWYEGQTEATYFAPPRTPHAMEAIENPAEHPDDRESWEKTKVIVKDHLLVIRQMLNDETLQVQDFNPLYRPAPAPEFYRQTLTACWAEAARLLKPGGILAFTFHHSEDEPWLDVLESLFNAGYILVATYPIRSDEMKGDNAQFGSQKIEYDIIHVCRKRLETPEIVSWSQMRRWVKDEAQRLKALLEVSHGQDLIKEDLLVILRGKALEYYSRHYGQILTGDNASLDVREALLGINLLLEDLVYASDGQQRPPDTVEPATRFFLSISQGKTEVDRDELHKRLRGTGLAPDDLEAHGWLSILGTTVTITPIIDRFVYFTMPGRNRKILKTDLDQAHFLIGAALPKSGTDITEELNRHTFHLKKSVDAILDWYAQTHHDEAIKTAAKLALSLVTHWRAQPQAQPHSGQQLSIFAQLEAEEG